MNVRVFLILLTSGLLMAVWSSDKAAEQAFLAERARMRAARHLVRQSAAPPATPLRNTGGVSRQTPVRRPDTREVSLARGVYRAVSDTGETFQVTIDRDESAESRARDLYILDAPDGTRWYFVRIRRPNVRG